MKLINVTAHLGRRITSGHWIPELDGLRFIAITTVVLFHLQGQLLKHYAGLTIAPRYVYLARFFGFGNRGVPLFFMISGFILARPFAQHHLFGKPAPLLRKYFMRRVTRLEPPYVLNMVVLALSLVFIEHKTLGIVLPHLIASLFYMHYFIYRDFSLINPVAWSLEIEVQFYILAPLLCLLFVIKRAGLRRLLTIAILVTAVALQAVFKIGPRTLAGQLQYFLAGLLFADIFLTLMPRWKHHWIWDVVSLIGWPAVFLFDGPLLNLWLPLLALVLYIAAFRGIVVPPFLRNPWVAVTGGMCYTIYLWHAPIITVVVRALDKFPAIVPSDYALVFTVHAIIKVVAIAFGCLPLFLFVERPCMDPNWPQKLLDHLRHKSTSSQLRTPTSIKNADPLSQSLEGQPLPPE